jgi:HSP90 family molecular chaperone
MCERIKERQKGIYWISRETKKAVANLLMLKVFRKK